MNADEWTEVWEKYHSHFEQIRAVVANVFTTVELDDELATDWLADQLVLLVERDGIRFIDRDRLKIKNPDDSDPGYGMYL